MRVRLEVFPPQRIILGAIEVVVAERWRDVGRVQPGVLEVRGGL